MMSQARANRAITILFSIFLSASLWSCDTSDAPKEPVDDVLLADTEPVTAPVISDPAPWLDLSAPAMPDTAVIAQPGWDQFAWQSFIAMNFPAIAPADSNPSNPYNLRGFPDTKNYQSFADAQPSSTTVWETLKEKREVFNHPTGLPVWNAAVDYGPVRMGDSPPIQAPPGTRIFHQGHKSTFDSLDETTEVQSEAREDNYPDGTPNPVKGFVVSPRIYQKATVQGTTKYFPVLYEVKVNWDFYNYVKTNGYYKSNQDASAQVYTDASMGQINLPYRGSAAKSPKGKTTNPAAGYDQQTVLATLNKVAADPSAQNADTTPPPVGSIHLKAVWIMLKDPATGVNLVSNPDSYHQATAAYFLSNSSGAPVMQTSLFGLAGIHLIQRVHAEKQDGTASAVGGTFIFATFEHEDIDTLDFVYSNFYQNKVALGPPAPQSGWYPPDLDNAYKVQPLLPYNPILANTAQVNTNVQQKLAAAGSFWANYRLRGTQFTAINFDDTPGPNPQYPPSVADPTGIGQPVFLANLLAETNHGLQHFQGQPPGTNPIPKYFYKTTPTVPNPFPTRPPYPSNAGNEGTAPNSTGIPGPFSRNTTNVSHGTDGLGTKSGFNMGGCMGCHGVVQSRGFSFSFVLLGGYIGSATDTQTIFDSQPATLPPGAN